MDDQNTQITPEVAKADAVDKAKDAQQAIEIARKAELAQTVADTAVATKAAILEGLREVFGDRNDPEDPDNMKVLVRRIPLICNDIAQIHSNISKINDNISWGVKIIIGAVILGVLKLTLFP